MEVRITFDTEKESLNELKRLVASLQDLIKKREKSQVLNNPLTTNSIKTPSQIKLEEQQKVEANTSINQFSSSDQRTTGGGRVIPYDKNISDSLAKILSGRKY